MMSLPQSVIRMRARKGELSCTSTGGVLLFSPEVLARALIAEFRFERRSK